MGLDERGPVIGDVLVRVDALQGGSVHALRPGTPQQDAAQQLPAESRKGLLDFWGLASLRS